MVVKNRHNDFTASITCRTDIESRIFSSCLCLVHIGTRRVRIADSVGRHAAHNGYSGSRIPLHARTICLNRSDNGQSCLILDSHHTLDFHSGYVPTTTTGRQNKLMRLLLQRSIRTHDTLLDIHHS